MKLLISLTSVILIAFSFNLQDSSNILALQKSNKIQLNVVGNSSSTHYLNPLKAEIKNLSNKMQNIEIPAGLHFVSDDAGIQDIIITQTIQFALKAGTTKSIELSGVCIQNYNSSPKESSTFTVKDYGEKKLWELAKFLDDKNIQNSQGQQAMWVLSDAKDPMNIIGFDDKYERELLELTLSLAGLDQITEEAYKKYKHDIVSPTYKSSLKGSFTMKFARGKQVQIAIFNENNVLMKEILNEWVEAGNRKVEYQLETTGLDGKTIYTQLIAGGVVWSRREINIPG